MPVDPAVAGPSGLFAPVTCARCGSAADQPGLDWMFEMDPRRGGVWVCGRCARDNVRSIEAKLDQEWW